MTLFLRRLFLLSVLICSLVAFEAKAEEQPVANDIGLISIDSPAHLQAANEIIGSALARTTNGYLIEASYAEQGRLKDAGIRFELLLTATDPAMLSLALQDRPEAPQDAVNFAPLQAGVELGGGATLVRLDATLARSLSETTSAKVIPLEDRSVSFHYDHPIYTQDLSALADFSVDTIADLISQDSIFAYDQHLMDYGTRYVYSSQIDQARDWMINKLKSWGYTDATYQQFWYNNGWRYNVMAVKVGYAEPDNVIVVGGHYDSWNSQSNPYSYAPGADDDGSGTSLTLELARVLADIPLRKTVIFMPFTAEEVGLIGSDYAAENFSAEGTDIEVMFNFDMVGYDPNNDWELELQSGPNNAYLNLHAEIMQRVTPLTPVIGSLGSSSDHYSFHSEGFNIVNNIEANFNFPGWHTDADLTSNMNFPYLTDVTRAAVVSVATVALSAAVETVEFIADVGDGQSLEVFWSDCHPDYTYTIYYGLYAGAKTDSITDVSGVCSYIVNGLAEGSRYHFQVFANVADGLPSIYAISGSETPLHIPRAPVNISAGPGLGVIDLSWTANIENDFASYTIYRKESAVGSWASYVTGLTTLSYVDTDVQGGIEFYYRLTATDLDMNESPPSEEKSTFAATFDQGVLVVDESRTEQWAIPEQSIEEAWLDTIFSGAEFGLVQIDSFPQTLTKGDAARFSSIVWLDDDYSYAMIDDSNDSLVWYASHGNNIFVAGWQMLWNWSPTPTIPTDHLLYTDFRLRKYEINIGLDFLGATGQAGWPTVTLDPTRGYIRLPMIPKLETRPGAEVIYTYDSHTDNPNYEGQPVGIAYDSPNGKRVLLSFPLYYLTPESAKNLITKLMDYFGEEVVILPCCGKYTSGFVGNTDCDPDGKRNLTDIIQLIDHVYIGKAPLCCPENGELSNPADGLINLSDITALIAHVYITHDETPACP